MEGDAGNKLSDPINLRKERARRRRGEAEKIKRQILDTIPDIEINQPEMNVGVGIDIGWLMNLDPAKVIPIKKPDQQGA